MFRNLTFMRCWILAWVLWDGGWLWYYLVTANDLMALLFAVCLVVTFASGMVSIRSIRKRQESQQWPYTD